MYGRFINGCLVKMPTRFNYKNRSYWVSENSDTISDIAKEMGYKKIVIMDRPKDSHKYYIIYEEKDDVIVQAWTKNFSDSYKKSEVSEDFYLHFENKLKETKEIVSKIGKSLQLEGETLFSIYDSYDNKLVKDIISWMKAQDKYKDKSEIELCHLVANYECNFKTNGNNLIREYFKSLGCEYGVDRNGIGIEYVIKNGKKYYFPIHIKFMTISHLIKDKECDEYLINHKMIYSFMISCIDSFIMSSLEYILKYNGSDNRKIEKYLEEAGYKSVIEKMKMLAAYKVVFSKDDMDDLTFFYEKRNAIIHNNGFANRRTIRKIFSTKYKNFCMVGQNIVPRYDEMCYFIKEINKKLDLVYYETVKRYGL